MSCLYRTKREAGSRVRCVVEQSAPTEDAMKITTLALGLAVSIATISGGCSKDKKVAKPTTPTEKPIAAKPADQKLLEQVPADTQVSQSLALSGDIVQL